jgi:GntR family transcriptional regulator/MocR family aminotransferase
MRTTLQEALRAAIQEGRLRAGTVLPASRQLADDLGVSRGVVSDSYDQLISEGYLEVKPRSAPVVSTVVTTVASAPEPPLPVWRFDFKAYTPEVGLFPRRAWARATERALRSTGNTAFDYGDHRGRVELRTALSVYLARARGVRVDPSRIVITQGFTQALDTLCHVLVGAGQRTLAMETPSHPGLWTTVRQSGLELVGCPVDDDGLRVGDLAGLHAQAVVVAPAHQCPTGAVMSAARRSALVEWAVTSGALIIEDDYDAEFRYDRTPIGAVQGLDPEHVAHVGSASKTLAPGVRLGWISAPAELVSDLQERKYSADSGSPVIEQLALADMLSSGEYDRQVVRARHVYRRRRDLLVAVLAARMPGVAIRGVAAGMQLFLPLADHTDDVAIAAAAAARGIRLEALSPLHLIQTGERGLVLGYGRLPEVKIADGVTALAAVLDEFGGLR